MEKKVFQIALIRAGEVLSNENNTIWLTKNGLDIDFQSIP